MKPKKRIVGASVPAHAASESNGASRVRPLELARILVLSQNEVAELTQSGVLKRMIVKQGKQSLIYYDKDENIERYIRHMREPERRAREEWLQEKRDTARIVREHKELDLAIARGDAVMREPITTAVVNAVSVMKNNLLALPIRLPRLLQGQSDPAKIRVILKTHVMLCLRAVENLSVDSIEKASKNGHDVERKRQTRIAARFRS